MTYTFGVSYAKDARLGEPSYIDVPPLVQSIMRSEYLTFGLARLGEPSYIDVPLLVQSIMRSEYLTFGLARLGEPSYIDVPLLVQSILWQRSQLPAGASLWAVAYGAKSRVRQASIFGMDA